MNEDNLIEDLFGDIQPKKAEPKKKRQKKVADDKGPEQQDFNLDDIDPSDDFNPGVEGVIPAFTNEIVSGNVIAIPNPLTVAAISTVNDKDAGKPVFKQKMGSLGRTEMYFSGGMLTQTDMDIWFTIIGLMRGMKVGSTLYVRKREIARAMGKSEGGSFITETLIPSLERLSAASFIIRYPLNGKMMLASADMLKFHTDEENGPLALTLDTRIARLFDSLARMSLNVRLSLPTPTSKGVYTYLIGQKDDRDHSVNMLALKQVLQYSGKPSAFKTALEKALAELEDRNIIRKVEGKSEYLVKIEPNKRTSDYKLYYHKIKEQMFIE